MKLLLLFIIAIQFQGLKLKYDESIFNVDLDKIQNQFQSSDLQDMIKKTQENQQNDKINVKQQGIEQQLPQGLYQTLSNKQKFGWNQYKNKQNQKAKPIGGIQFWANIPNLYEK